MRPQRDITLLWALRSPCSFACDYCYFGSLEEHRENPPTRPGQLSHLPHGDLPLPAILRFLSTIGRSSVKRVFLAGGEPLIWAPIAHVIETLADAGVQVTVCTNGVPLNRGSVSTMLLDTGVRGVSVSLDSADPVLNDLHRPARNRADGWHSVVAGIKHLIAERGTRTRPAIGLYSVITRRTLPGLPATARFAAGLGVDYFVAQPVALDPGHPLHDELALRTADLPALARAFDHVYGADLGLELPAPRYPRQVASPIEYPLQTVRGCFGGHQLAFIQPDGSVWDCPSSHKIAAGRPGGAPTIASRTAAELFPTPPATGGRDCPLFSGDCVNMWPLMGDFDRFLGARIPDGTQ
ncbi:MAG TPA: radical SAM protein [Pseudonocardiaceae bacterium]|nr:radical SAM protein [Pseudonocardiaceae bacterium]